MEDRFTAQRFPQGWRVVDTRTGHTHSAVIQDRARCERQAAELNAKLATIGGEFTGYGARTEEGARRHMESLERIDRDRIARGEVRYFVRRVTVSGRDGYRVYRKES